MPRRRCSNIYPWWLQQYLYLWVGLGCMNMLFFFLDYWMHPFSFVLKVTKAFFLSEGGSNVAYHFYFIFFNLVKVAFCFPLCNLWTMSIWPKERVFTLNKILHISSGFSLWCEETVHKIDFYNILNWVTFARKIQIHFWKLLAS